MNFTETEIIDGAKSIGVDGAAVINSILELQRVRGSFVETVRAEVLETLKTSRFRVDAVKLVRQRLGYGLKEAVDFVNSVQPAK